MMFDAARFQKRAMLLATFICLAPITGCLTTPVSSMVKLAKLTPLDANPSDMRVAVRGPYFLRVRDGDISVTISFETNDKKTSFVESYKPIVEEDARPEAGISFGAQDGSRLSIAKFSPEDAASMRAAQIRIKEMRANGVQGKGSFSVGAKGCATDKLPDGPILLTTWLRSSPTEDYFVLTRNINLRDVLDTAKIKAEDIPLCDQAPSPRT